jgi:hypothetical protein
MQETKYEAIRAGEAGMSSYAATLLSVARSYLGVTETEHNSGPEIDAWLDAVHCPPGKPWCMAYVHGVAAEAAKACGVANPCPRTAGALRAWELAPEVCKTQLPAPGDVFVLDTGEPGGAGHVGIVETVSPDGRTVTSIEGNSNQEGSREGDSVVIHKWRPVDGKRGKLIGFLSLETAIPKAAPVVDALADTEPAPVGVASLPPSPFK